MSLPIWNNLNKTLDDDTKIEEAIDSAIAAHNDDQQAHLDANQAIEAHRDNSVVDHPEKSVVNDKLQVGARSVNAIVDENDPEAFDDIESAIDAAFADGGGTVYLVDGVHEMSQQIDIPTNVGLLGQSKTNTILQGGADNDGYLSYELRDNIHSDKSRIENLTIETNGGRVIESDDADNTLDFRVVFRDVNFIGDDHYIRAYDDDIYLYDCQIAVGSTHSITTNANITMQDTRIYVGPSGGFFQFIDRIAFEDEPKLINIERCHFDWDDDGLGYWFAAFNIDTIRMINSECYGLLFEQNAPTWILSNNQIGTSSNHIIGIGRTNSRVINNDWTNGTNNSVFVSDPGDHCIVAYNIGYNFQDDTSGGTDNIVNNNIEV